VLSKYAIWNALYVRSRHEKKVADFFAKNGWECYLPLHKSLKIWSDRKKLVEEPLFRGYIFIPHNPLLHDKVLQVPGVVNFVRYNGQNANIKSQELKTIQYFIDKGYHLQSMGIDTFETGEFVHIQAGIFKGLKAQIQQEHKNKKEYILLLESLGQIVKISLPAEILKKV
jgi:transcription antitermination factor NusG